MVGGQTFEQPHQLLEAALVREAEPAANQIPPVRDKDAIIGSMLIIYLCAFVGFFKYFIQTRLRKADERKAAKAAQIQEGGEDK